MTPRTGQMAPAFSGRSDQGEALGLEGLAGSWAVLAFLPRAGTPDSVLEVRGFEEALPAFSRLNARVVGVSADTEARLARFREQQGLSFALLPDRERRVARAYGLLGGLSGVLGLRAQQTFLIHPDGRLAAHWRWVSPAGHPAEVRRRLEELSVDEQRGSPPH